MLAAWQDYHNLLFAVLGGTHSRGLVIRECTEFGGQTMQYR